MTPPDPIAALADRTIRRMTTAPDNCPDVSAHARQCLLAFLADALEELGVEKALELANAPFADMEDATIAKSVSFAPPHLKQKAEMAHAVRQTLTRIRAVAAAKEAKT